MFVVLSITTPIDFLKGSLLQCLDSMTSFVALENFKEVQDLCEKAVEAIVLNISNGKVMKVRWNACYAAGGLLKTQHAMICHDASRQKLIQALVPVMQNCPNYKVRINASLALASVQHRQTFGELYVSTAVAVTLALEAAVTNVEDSEEIQHRSDLIDQLCITYAHLVSIANNEDVIELARRVESDQLADAMRSALLRISPEKTTVFVEARRHISTTLAQSANKDDLDQLFPAGLVDSLLVDCGNWTH